MLPQVNPAGGLSVGGMLPQENSAGGFVGRRLAASLCSRGSAGGEAGQRSVGEQSALGLSCVLEWTEEPQVRWNSNLCIS